MDGVDERGDEELGAGDKGASKRWGCRILPSIRKAAGAVRPVSSMK
jgi:hypothetical protein